MKNYLLICIIFFSANEITPQVIGSSSINEEGLSWFVSINYGYQMSGIKDEDFVSSNYSPLFNVSLGKQVSRLFAFQVGYKGFYFNYIEDDFKHHYNYLYTESIFYLVNAIVPARKNKDWDISAHAGFGIFNNHLLNKNQVCINLGIQNYYLIDDNLEITIDISSIIGWQIYQGDEDILPGITAGIIYSFH